MFINKVIDKLLEKGYVVSVVRDELVVVARAS